MTHVFSVPSVALVKCAHQVQLVEEKPYLTYTLEQFIIIQESQGRKSGQEVRTGTSSWNRLLLNESVVSTRELAHSQSSAETVEEAALLVGSRLAGFLTQAGTTRPGTVGLTVVGALLYQLTTKQPLTDTVTG